ncbi:MAG: DinB family protein [Gemmatimonadota bacterium]|nr:MAG: DinB family protein [Gemmatimonadota bacterium]
MKPRHLLLTLGLAALPLPAAAQQMEEHSKGMAAVQPLYETVKGWLIASAEQMPEENYSYRPTPEVRNFSELMGHVANTTFMFCAGATGGDNPNSTDYEEVASKAEIVEGIKASFEYCDAAYQMSEATAMEEITFFRQTGSRLWVLMFNVAHNMEHYGNVVTYMRLNGMVPPSSQRGM